MRRNSWGGACFVDKTLLLPPWYGHSACLSFGFLTRLSFGSSDVGSFTHFRGQQATGSAYDVLPPIALIFSSVRRFSGHDLGWPIPLPCSR